MKSSIATVSLAGDLAEKIDAIAAAGFEGLEIFENDLLSFSGSTAQARALIADRGLELIAFQPFRDFEGMVGAQRDKAFARAERKFDLLEDLGTSLLMVCSNVSPDSEGNLERAAADFHELGERAKVRNIRIGFEALAWGRHISDYRDAWEVVRRANHPNVGIALDSFHICARQTDLAPIRFIPKDRIFLVQLSDAPMMDMNLMHWSRHFRCFPAQGDLPIAAFMDAVEATGYDGWLSLETFNDLFRAGSARSIAVDGRRSLLHVLDQQARKAGATPAYVPARMPPPARCEGVEFIEFAVDETQSIELARMLAGLGFSLVGRHVSKAVTHWKQGGINLVVNLEKDGFAHSFNIAHGPGVCALALEVGDATATLDRAEKLLDKPFRQAVGPGELEIPAVRGLGGSLLYFLDAKSPLAHNWEIDFVTTGNAVGADAGLQCVDHISQSMQYEEVLTWLLFYNSLFDVEKSQDTDIADPGGLVRSQVVQTRDGSLRIVLNGSQSNRTLSSRFLSEFLGSGVQHIAFATDDILSTVARLRAAGVGMLEIPGNYYDDLAARTELSPERLEKLQACNILYDRDEHGEYLQAYTTSFESRFFFEIVERRGYKGFGAINASIRLGAQARHAKPPGPPAQA